MTENELQEVVAAVIQSLKTNGKTIEQLTDVTTVGDSDYIELHSGRKVSFETFKTAVSNSIEITANQIRGWVIIESTADLPTEPTPEQQMLAYLLDTTLYVYVGTGGDTLDGLYKSAQLKGADGSQGIDGNGIASIEKTGSSGYVDTYTITYDDETTSTFTVTNGINGVDLGAVNLVNDLTTGGEGAALTAEMGKELKTLVDSQTEESRVITTFNSGYYYSKEMKLVANAAFIYSDFYPVEEFVQATGMIKNSVTANIAYFSMPCFSNGSWLGYYLGSSTAAAGVTIDRATFEANMPTGAKYFTISVEQKSTNVVSLTLTKNRIDNLESQVTDITPHVLVPSTVNAQSIMTIGEYWNKNTSAFVSSTSWKRTGYLDLDVYSKIVATIPVYANNWPHIIYFDANKAYIREEHYPAPIPSGVTSNTFVFNKASSNEKYAVVCAQISNSQDYSLTLYAYVDKLLAGQEDYSNADMTFTEPRSGAAARLITSNTLDSASTDEFLMIFITGNGGSISDLDTMSAEALTYFRSHHISIATMTLQAALYGSQSTNKGWGNDVCYNAICDLYTYLMAKYPFRKDVILAGGSMGGLTMGQIAYKKPFPVRFCLGVGAAPGLEICWTQSGLNYSTIHADMREAYGLASDGSEDDQFATKSQGYDWRTMGWVGTGEDSQKIGFPNIYFYYGADGVETNLFGGVENYNTLRDALLNAGVYSMVKSIGTAGHASFTIFTTAINDGVFERELKTVE